MKLHDRVASTLSLARTLLAGVDPRADTTNIRTASLVLLLETLIDLGSPGSQSKMTEAAHRTVLGHIESLNKASEAVARLIEAEPALQESAMAVSRG